MYQGAVVDDVFATIRLLVWAKKNGYVKSLSSTEETLLNELEFLHPQSILDVVMMMKLERLECKVLGNRLPKIYQTGEINFGGFCLNFASRLLKYRGKEIYLDRATYHVLARLASTPDEYVSILELKQYVASNSSSAVRVRIGHLRRMMREHSGFYYIETKSRSMESITEYKLILRGKRSTRLSF